MTKNRSNQEAYRPPVALTPEQLAQIDHQTLTRPVQEIPEEELFLYVPMGDLTITEWKPLGRWAKLAHEMLEQDLARLVELTRQGPTAYEELLEMIDSTYPDREYELTRTWQENHPVVQGESRASWINQARLSAREILAEQLSVELGLE